MNSFEECDLPLFCQAQAKIIDRLSKANRNSNDHVPSREESASFALQAAFVMPILWSNLVKCKKYISVLSWQFCIHSMVCIMSYIELDLLHVICIVICYVSWILVDLIITVNLHALSNKRKGRTQSPVKMAEPEPRALERWTQPVPHPPFSIKVSWPEVDTRARKLATVYVKYSTDGSWLI